MVADPLFMLGSFDGVLQSCVQESCAEARLASASLEYLYQDVVNNCRTWACLLENENRKSCKFDIASKELELRLTRANEEKIQFQEQQKKSSAETLAHKRELVQVRAELAATQKRHDALNSMYLTLKEQTEALVESLAALAREKEMLLREVEASKSTSEEIVVGQSDRQEPSITADGRLKGAEGGNNVAAGQSQSTTFSGAQLNARRAEQPQVTAVESGNGETRTVIRRVKRPQQSDEVKKSVGFVRGLVSSQTRSQLGKVLSTWTLDPVFDPGSTNSGVQGYRTRSRAVQLRSQQSDARLPKDTVASRAEGHLNATRLSAVNGTSLMKKNADSVVSLGRVDHLKTDKQLSGDGNESSSGNKYGNPMSTLDIKASQKRSASSKTRSPRRAKRIKDNQDIEAAEARVKGMPSATGSASMPWGVATLRSAPKPEVTRTPMRQRLRSSRKQQ